MLLSKEKYDRALALLAAAYPDVRPALEYSSPFELLVSTMLAAQCTDKRVNECTRVLYARYHTPEQFAALTQEAHRAVRARQSGGCAMMSTIALLAVEGRLARWAHVGDTRLYRFLDGKLVFQSRDHSASQAAVLLGEITPEQIRFHPSRSRVLRALGQEGELRVEQGSARLEAGQNAFLLCTDGFWEYVYENEMAETLRRSSSPQEWLERMRRYIAARAPRDNDNNTAAAVWA